MTKLHVIFVWETARRSCSDWQHGMRCLAVVCFVLMTSAGFIGNGRAAVSETKGYAEANVNLAKFEPIEGEPWPEPGSGEKSRPAFSDDSNDESTGDSERDPGSEDSDKSNDPQKAPVFPGLDGLKDLFGACPTTAQLRRA